MSKLTCKEKQEISNGSIDVENLKKLISISCDDLSYLDKGGTGVIYALKELEIKEKILKINVRLGNGKNDKDRKYRFDREIDILNQLKSCNKANNLCVIKILDDYKQHPECKNDLQWYVVEKGDKVTDCLLDKLNNSSSPYEFFKFIVEKFIDLFKTLDYLHTNNIAHRDIKPANLVFDTISEKFLFIDFGIAKNNNLNNIKITENNEKDKYSLGPKITMPPEMEEDPAKANPYKADIYSLTKTMYLFIKAYKDTDYCFKGQFNKSYHHYKDVLIERYNSLHKNKNKDFLTFYEDEQLINFLYTNTHDNPDYRMTAKESFEKLEIFLDLITPIDWASKKDQMYQMESEHNCELYAYIIDLFGGEVENLIIKKNNITKKDYLFIRFLNDLSITKKIKNNIELDDINISYQDKNLLFFDNDKIDDIIFEIEKYCDKDNETYYSIKIILNNEINKYIYEYNSFFEFM